MSASVPTELHHLVCRDCSLERLLDAHDDADAVRRDHVSATGHRVVVDRVQ